jgi:hypothetical protein
MKKKQWFTLKAHCYIRGKKTRKNKRNWIRCQNKKLLVSSSPAEIKSP